MRHTRQAGQAMIETLIVASLVLVPLFLGIPLLGKYLDLRSHALQAARYAAWERTVYFGGASASEIGWAGFTNAWIANEKTDSEIGSEVAVRLLSRTDASSTLSNSDKSLNGFKAGQHKLLWQDRNGQSMISYANLQTSAAQACDMSGGITDGLSGYDCAPGTINRVLAPIAKVAAFLGPFTLEMGGKYTANVTLNPKKFDQTSFLMSNVLMPSSEHVVLLGNGWSADGPDDKTKTSVKQQVKGLTPTSLLAAEITLPVVGTFSILHVVQTVFSIWAPELSSRKLQIGKIEPDIVPEDRLQ